MNFSVRGRLFPLTWIFSWHAKKDMIYIEIVHCLNVNRWIVYREIGQHNLNDFKLRVNRHLLASGSVYATFRVCF